MVFSFCYVLLSALFGVVLNYMSTTAADRLPDELLIFLVVSYALVAYHAISYKNLGKTYKKLSQVKKIDVAILLILITISLTGCFYVPLYFTPSILSFTFMAISSCCASFSLFYKQRAMHNLWVFLAIIIIIIGFYIWHYHQFSLSMFYLMIAGTLITGISSYLYFVESYKFNVAGLTAIEVLTCRFWLLFIVFGLICIAKGDFYYISWIVLLQTFLIAVLVLILPIYFSQKAIEKIGPELHGIILGFTPLLSYILENLVLKIHNHIMLFFSLALAVIVAIQKRLLK